MECSSALSVCLHMIYLILLACMRVWRCTGYICSFLSLWLPLFSWSQTWGLPRFVLPVSDSPPTQCGGWKAESFTPVRDGLSKCGDTGFKVISPARRPLNMKSEWWRLKNLKDVEKRWRTLENVGEPVNTDPLLASSLSQFFFVHVQRHSHQHMHVKSVTNTATYLECTLYS